jgi:L-fuculose-phosphate aldolase
MITSDSDARRLIVQACRVLKANGHDDYIWGHVTVRDEAGRGVWMKPSGMGFEEVFENDVILINHDGVVIDGDRSRHSEWPIHAEIMAAREDVRAVVHTHPPHAIAFAAAGQPLLPLSHAGTLFYPPEVPRFDETSNLVMTKQLGTALAAVLGTENAAFMVNHGIVTAGASLQEAVVRAVLLEKACQQQLLALQAGSPLVWPDADAARDKRSTVWPPAHLDALWEYLVRTLPIDRSNQGDI